MRDTGAKLSRAGKPVTYAFMVISKGPDPEWGVHVRRETLPSLRNHGRTLRQRRVRWRLINAHLGQSPESIKRKCARHEFIFFAGRSAGELRLFRTTLWHRTPRSDRPQGRLACGCDRPATGKPACRAAKTPAPEQTQSAIRKQRPWNLTRDMPFLFRMRRPVCQTAAQQKTAPERAVPDTPSPMDQAASRYSKYSTASS